MNKKRQMWVRVCALFTAVWLFAGMMLAWPLLILAVFSALMILIPVGVSTNEPPVRQHDTDSWRTDKNRPWR
jgi:hypothetical protein